jgi:hypothetical protein
VSAVVATAASAAALLAQALALRSLLQRPLHRRARAAVVQPVRAAAVEGKRPAAQQSLHEAAEVEAAPLPPALRILRGRAALQAADGRGGAKRPGRGHAEALGAEPGGRRGGGGGGRDTRA